MSVSQGIPVALDKHVLGFDTGGECCFLKGFKKKVRGKDTITVYSFQMHFLSDAVLNEAAQILRLLHIEELRELQTKINEAIVAVQAIIADPKTDHRLGKVGR